MKNILLGLLLVVVFCAGFFIGKFSSVINIQNIDQLSPTDSAKDTNESTNTSGDAQTGETSESVQESTSPTTPAMTAQQRQMLESFGIDPNTVTITAEMEACAEAKLGVARIEEIKAGATPSLMEGFSLMGCFSQ